MNSNLVQNASSAITNSQLFTKASDGLKRRVGVDIRGALGGKSAVEKAEERLQADRASGGY